MLILLFVSLFAGFELGGKAMKKAIHQEGGFCYIETKRDYSLKHCYLNQKDGESEKISNEKHKKSF